VTLDASDIAVINRALSEILVGPAAVPGASGGEADWELLGGVSADRFAEVRSDINALAE
jgi:hypothetical protein